VQTSALTFSSIGANSITLNYTRGNGTNCIIIAKQGGAVTATPIDGTTYTANTTFGSGTNISSNEYVVYMGAANSVTISGLNPTTLYGFKIFEYNGIGCTTNFLITSPLIGSATTLSCVIAIQPTVQSSGLTASSILASTLNLNWTRGNGAYCMVVGRAIMPVSTPPTDGTAYTANATFGLGSTTAPAEYVLYSGTGNAVFITGLNPNTQYYFSVYEFNGSGCTANYLTSGVSSINATTLNVTSYNYYYGTLHSHSDYSDGDLDNVCNGANSAYCCYDIGNTALNFDFMGISDHNHNEGPVMTLAKYASGVAEATSYNSTHTDFAALYGMEWGTISTGGHVTVYGINQLIGWNAGNYNIYCAKGDYNSLFNLVANTPGAYSTLCHPNNTDFAGLFNNPYNAIYDNAIVGVAMRNGPYNSLNTAYSDPSTWSNLWFYQTLLSKGYHLGPTCDLDNHNSATMGKSSQQRTAILGTAISKAAVNDAMLNMRFYATDDYNAQVSFDINTTFIMGNIASQFADPTIHVTVTDGNGESTDSIRIYYGVPGSNVLPTQLTFVKNSSTLTFTHVIAPGATYYYYAEIRQPDGNKIWTAPIWFTKLLTNPLPLNLLRFDGEKSTDCNLLTWCTATEIMTDYFVLEKSIDGINFTPLANIDAVGFSLQPANYSYKDYEKSSTVNYYRLQQFYVDGNSDFSNVIVLADDNISNQVQIYPNPTQGLFNIIYANNQRSTFNVRISDSKGKTVFQRNDIQDQYVNCSLLNFAPGIYTITVYDDTISSSQNIVLKK
jgi:hypothetical protein